MVSGASRRCLYLGTDESSAKLRPQSHIGEEEKGFIVAAMKIWLTRRLKFTYRCIPPFDSVMALDRVGGRYSTQCIHFRKAHPSVCIVSLL